MKASSARLVALGAFAVATLGGFWLYRSSHASEHAAKVASTTAHPRVTWPAGTSRRYALAWRSSNGVTLANDPRSGAGEAGSGSMTLAFDIDGDLVLSSYGVHDDRYLLTAKLENLRRFDLSINGNAIYPDVAAASADLVGHTATFDVDTEGTIQRFTVDADPSGLFRHLMRAALLQLQLTVPKGSEPQWQASEHTPNGNADTQYAIDPAHPSTLLRSHLRYETLAAVPGASLTAEAARRNLRSKGVFVLEGSGAIQSFSEDEVLTTADEGKQNVVSDNHFSLALSASTPIETATLPSLAGARPLSERSISSTMQQRMLEQRVNGLTFERVQKDFIILAGGADIIDQHRWAWRATGLLTQQPELCDKLVPIFRDNDVVAVRALIVDLLASTGHHQAQAAMRQALSSPEAAKDKSLMLYMQRIGFVTEPEPETVDFLWARFDADGLDKESKLADALLYTLGSATRHLNKSGDKEHAEASHARLIGLLEKASGSHARKVGLAALGNAGFPADSERLLGFSSDENIEVRSQVAWSLRKFDRPEVHRAALMLLGDSAMAVQASVLQVFSEWTVQPADIAALDAAVHAHPIDPENCAALVALLARADPHDSHALSIYKSLLERADLDADVRATIYDRIGSAAASSNAPGLNL